MIGLGTKAFLDILRKASISKTPSKAMIENVGFKLEEDGLKACIMPDSETLIEYYFIPKKRFDLYKPDVDFIAFNVPNIYGLVKELFKGRINIKVDKDQNRLIIEDAKKEKRIDTQLLDISAVKQADESSLEVTDKYVVPKNDNVVFHGRVPRDKFKSFLKLTTKNVEAVKFTFKGNEIFLDYKRGLVNVHDRISADVEISSMNVSGMYPAYLVIKPILSVLSGDITFTVTESGVMSIGKVTDVERIHYMFAPVEEE